MSSSTNGSSKSSSSKAGLPPIMGEKTLLFLAVSLFCVLWWAGMMIFDDVAQARARSDAKRSNKQIQKEVYDPRHRATGQRNFSVRYR